MSKIQAVDCIKKYWTKFKNMSAFIWINKHKFVSFISILAIVVVIFILCLFFKFEDTMLYIGVNYEEIKSQQWEVIKNVGYALGVLLLIMQISISNRRADASEKTAEATLAGGVEQRYHNAVSHLANENPVTRIGAIYNLYHISQSTDTYDATIFDMFCQYLRSDKNKVSVKERQIIIDKLFKAEAKDRVLENPKKIDLTGVDLTGVDLTGVDLTGANLTNATLPDDLENIKSMNNATIDEVNFNSGSNLQGLELKDGSWQNATVRYTNLSNANLSGTKLNGTDFTGTNFTGTDFTGANFTGTDFTGANFTGANFTGTDFTGAKGLTFEKLSKVKCLHQIKGLNEEFIERLEKLELFKPIQ